MPQWIAQPELDAAGAVPAGTVVEESITSRVLGGTRRVWFYTPPGYDATEDWYPVLYVLDGGNYVGRMEVPAVLDRLIARKAIEPVVAVFVEPRDRQRVLAQPAVAGVHGDRARAPRGRALPHVSSTREAGHPGQLPVGHGAVDLAVEYPAVFGLCAALAPPAQTPTVITNQAKGQDAIQAVKFFILAGTYDSMANGGRRLRTALGMGSGAVTYLEVPEGHSTETFRGHLDDALNALLSTSS
ncbi:MAG: alpha/beta hydrolase-fold protein [Vicinamibacterales bacterium]